MKNTIKVTIPFSFKGVEHTPSAVLDLDVLAQGDTTINSLFQLVANKNKIDNYSYEYEVLESSAKIFSEPTGIAAEFINDEGFDLEGFKTKHSEKGILEKLQSIASETLNIDNLAESEKIQNALMQAYQAGFKDKA